MRFPADSDRMLRPDEVEDAVAYGAARLVNTPLEQLQAQAAAHRAARGIPPPGFDAADITALDPADMAALAQDVADMAALADALGIDRAVVTDAMARSAGDVEVFMHLLGIDPERMADALNQSVDPQTWAMIDAIAYGLAKLLNTPLGELKADADAHRAYVGATPSAREQLQHLDRLVAAHETYWSALAQQNPHSAIMREFLRLHWDPWIQKWWSYRPYLDTEAEQAILWRWLHPGTTAADSLPTNFLADLIREVGGSLSQIRDFAAYNGIPIPDLGTARRGISYPGPARLAHEGESMSTHAGLTHAGWDTYAGADGSYPEVASRAVASVQQQNPSPIYGYLREGSQQKIYLFQALDQARSWFADLVQAQPHDYAAVFAAADIRRPVSGLESFGQPAVSGAHVGADGSSYPDVAARAVAAAYQQNPSAAYGYLREGMRQRIYLFHAVDQAHAWYTALVDAQAQPYDYAAVFAATDLSHPVPGLESFGQTTVSGAQVGSIWPFLLGLPLGALGGYAYRGWRDEHPGKWLPGISGEASVGGPWLDVEPIVGASYGHEQRYFEGAVAPTEREARRRGHALIQSAIQEVSSSTASYPAAAYVWSLDAPGPSSTPGVELMPETSIVPFPSYAQALDYMRARIQTPHLALAVFDRGSGRWPNPVNWTKSSDPADEYLIAQHVASQTPTHAAGVIGAWGASIGTAVDDVRDRAQSLATRRAGDVVGVIHTSRDGLWHTLAFRSTDDADDWFGTATQDPAAYTYAAYYDKQDYSWPHPVNEKLGGAAAQARPGSSIHREIATTR